MTLDTSVADNIRFFEAKPDPQDDNVMYLLLHGLGSSLDFWIEVAPALGLKRRTIAVDIPGFGKSPTPTDGFTLANVSSAIRKFCRSLNVSNCVLVAHSMGAFVALQLIVMESTRFRRLILVDGSLGRAVKLIKFPQRVLEDPRLGLYVFAQFAGGIIPVNHRMAKIISSSGIIRDLTLWPYIAHPSRSNPDILVNALADNGGLAVIKALAEARRVDYVELMQAVTCPVDLAWGDADHLIDRQDVEQACRFMDVDRKLRIPSCGHWPMIEQPEVLTTFIMSCERTVATSLFSNNYFTTASGSVALRSPDAPGGP